MKLIITLIFQLFFFAAIAQNVVFVVIDGARYTETLGDTNYSNIPHISQLLKQGATLDQMYNEHKTSTKFAIPALWTGSWDGSYKINYEGNETQATYRPSIFEYFRKQRMLDSTHCFYLLKEVGSLWLQSFHPDYGPDYWPATISSGNSDKDVLNSTLEVMGKYHPQLLWVYLADVDSKGHSGNWTQYISGIQTADEIVGKLWNAVQNDSVYKNNTTMFVTNDHGRHDDQHGGFKGHGCTCEGCQHIMFFAIGPNIKENYLSSEHHELADAAVTASKVLNIDPEFASGEVVAEIFKNDVTGTSGISYANLTQPELKININSIELIVDKPCLVTLEIFDVTGKKIELLAKNKFVEDLQSFELNSNYTGGLYTLRLQYGNKIISKRFYRAP